MEAKPKKEKAVAYMRVSTEEQVNGMSKETQETAIKQYAAANNLEIVGSYWDGGHSAKTAKRPDLQRLLEDIESGKYPNLKYVIVYNLSRMSRNVGSYKGGIIARLAKKGVTIRSTQEPIDDTPAGKLLENISVAVHQFENDNKAATVHACMGTAVKNGWWVSNPPIGTQIKKNYTGEKNTSGKKRYHATLEPNEDAGIVRELLMRYNRGEAEIVDLVELAKKMGLKTAFGNDLSYDAISRMLTQPAYAGLIRSEKLTGGELVKGRWEGIISEDIYRENLERFMNRFARKHPVRKYRKDRPEYPLKGCVYCSHCGKLLRGSAPCNGSGEKSPRYHCSECGAGSIAIGKLHEEFEELLKDVTPTKETIKLFKVIFKRTLRESLETVNKDLKKKRKEITDIDEQKAKALQKLINDKITREEKDLLDEMLNNQRLVLASEIAKLEARQSLSEAAIDRVVGFLDKPLKLWKRADLATRRLLQQMVFPDGLVYDLGAKKFGTRKISPLYSVIEQKIDPEESDFSYVVHSVGFEPATFGSASQRSIQLSYECIGEYYV